MREHCWKMGLLKNQKDRGCLYEAARTYFYLLQFDSAEPKINQLLVCDSKNPENFELAALFAIYRSMDQMHKPRAGQVCPSHFAKVFGCMKRC